jgi:arylsulfatase/arylsulfatase A
MRLSRQDWRGPRAGWNNDSVGHWLIEIEQAGRYRITLRSVNEFTRWRVALGQASKLAVESRPTRKSVTELRLATGPALLEALVGDETTWRGVHYVELEYLEGDMKK